jgi:hypothetical protein
MPEKKTVSEAFEQAAREVEVEVKRALDYIETNIVPKARRDGEKVLRRLCGRYDLPLERVQRKCHASGRPEVNFRQRAYFVESRKGRARLARVSGLRTGGTFGKMGTPRKPTNTSAAAMF